MRSTVHLRKQIDIDVEQKLAHLKNLANKTRMSPAESTVNKFLKTQNDLSKKYQEVLSTVIEKNTEKQLTPLEFKEELLKVQQFLQERAALWSIGIPISTGFREYEGGIIPADKDTMALLRQLRHIESIINIMIECKIQGIDSISKKINRVPDHLSHLNIQEMYSYEIQFRTSWDSLTKVLNKIFLAKQFYIVKKLDIQSKEANQLAITLAMDCVLFVLPEKVPVSE